MTTQEKLGYDKTEKLLIIHADDFGLCNSQNMATIKALEEGSVNSLSVMAPCPWFFQAAEYLKHRPHIDAGIHLTLKSEWMHYKYGPVLPAKEVPSLVDQNGYFRNDFDEVSISELAAECSAQIERVILHGINPTHIDCHMFALMKNPEHIDVYLELGKKYQLPVLTDKNLLQKSSCTLTGCQFHVDAILVADPSNYHIISLKDFYEHTLHNLRPGITVLLVHPAFDNQEMQAIAAYDLPGYGSRWRQQDVDFFTSKRCENIISDKNIKLITFKKISQVLKKHLYTSS
jgi:predicted glycoside hydrolase/deacetylase ChbG (UPF0249 family)